MSDNVDIVIADADDWQGLYVNGIIEYQDHRLDLHDVLLCLEGRTIVSAKKKYVDMNWIHNVGYLPEKIEEVIWEGKSE